ncbi:unnamed protein product [Tilletia controversa]|nr:unnamed protein product [Tilletia controversa]
MIVQTPLTTLARRAASTNAVGLAARAAVSPAVVATPAGVSHNRAFTTSHSAQRSSQQQQQQQQQPITRTSHRPRLSIPQQQQLHRQPPARTMFIQTETTPNEDSLKFLPGQRVMESGTAEFLDNRSSMSSPLAKRLFNVPGVRSVFYGPDFVTVSKHSDMPWSTLKPEVFATLMEFFSSGLALFAEGEAAQQVAQDTLILDTDSETVAMIKELLDTRVRPAIQEDGGDIEYRGWTDPEEGGDGIVRLMLKGSCQRMLMHYIPEVQGVEQVLDQEDEIALDEFHKFESKLEKDRQREKERGFSD